MKAVVAPVFAVMLSGDTGPAGNAYSIVPF